MSSKLKCLWLVRFDAGSALISADSVKDAKKQAAQVLGISESAKSSALDVTRLRCCIQRCYQLAQVLVKDDDPTYKAIPWTFTSHKPGPVPLCATCYQRLSIPLVDRIFALEETNDR